MSLLPELHVAILTYLSRETTPVSRYQVLTGINQTQLLFFNPYSTGAVYHGIKNLSATNMIISNQMSMKISEFGLNSIKQFFRITPFPTTAAQQIHWLLWLSYLTDSELKKQGLRRAEIEMIKYNQDEEIDKNLSINSRDDIIALKILRKNQSEAIRKSILIISANI